MPTKVRYKRATVLTIFKGQHAGHTKSADNHVYIPSPAGQPCGIRPLEARLMMSAVKLRSGTH